MSSSPLDHIVQHPIVQREFDAGMLTPEGVITVMSDHIFMTILSGAVLCLVFPWAIRRSRRQGEGEEKLVAGGLANLLEVVCQYLRKEVAEPALGEHTDRFIKYIWSLFFFVLTINMLGLVPLGSVTPLFGLHLGGTATANIWVTATLSLITMGMMVINGLRLGGIEYLKHFNPGPWWMGWLLVPIEIAGVFAKIFALTVRLFANMVAGHMVLAVLVGFIAAAGAVSSTMGFAIAVPVVLGSVALTMLEIFVALLQAFIFTFLTTLFIGMSVVFHHDDEHAVEGAAH